MLRRFTKLSQALGLILVVSLGLSGCAFEKLIFERFDWFAMYQIDSYLDLDKKQELMLKPAVTDAVAWLKKEQIPGALQTLEKLESAAKNHTYNEEVSRAFTNEIDSVRKLLFTKYEAPVMTLLSSLSKDQVQYLAKKLKKSNEDLEDVVEDDDPKAYDSILKKQRKTLKEYYGSLSDAQEKAFYSTMRLTKADVERRLSERKKVQAYIIQTLESGDRAKILSMVQSFRDTGEIYQDKAYVEYRQAQEKRWEAYLLDFHKSLTNEQWHHLEEKMKEMRGKLADMAGIAIKS